jgi:hypothetical protein
MGLQIKPQRRGAEHLYIAAGGPPKSPGGSARSGRPDEKCQDFSPHTFDVR